MTTVNLGVSPDEFRDEEVGMLRLAIGYQGLSDKYLKCDGQEYKKTDYPDFTSEDENRKVDAITLTARAQEKIYSSSYQREIAYGNGIYVFASEGTETNVANSIMYIYASTDLINWSRTRIVLNVSRPKTVGLTFVGGYFFAMTPNDYQVIYSSDGVTWKKLARFTDQAFHMVRGYNVVKPGYFKGLHYFWASNGIHTVDFSQAQPVVTLKSNITLLGDYFASSNTAMCCISRSGEIYRTTDGEAFELVYQGDLTSTAIEIDIIHIPTTGQGSAGRWLASFIGRKIIYSDDDGLTWSEFPSLTPGYFTHEQNGNIIILDYGRNMKLSQDGGKSFFGDVNGGSGLLFKRPISNGDSIIAISADKDETLTLNVYDPIPDFGVFGKTPVLKDPNGTFYYVRAKK